MPAHSEGAEEPLLTLFLDFRPITASVRSAGPPCGKRANLGLPAKPVSMRMAGAALSRSRALTMQHIAARLGVGMTNDAPSCGKLQPIWLTACLSSDFNDNDVSRKPSANFGCNAAGGTAMLRTMVRFVSAYRRAPAAEFRAPGAARKIPLARHRAVELDERLQLGIHPRSAPEQTKGHRNPHRRPSLRTASMTPARRPLAHLRPRGRTSGTSLEPAPCAVARWDGAQHMTVVSRGN